MRRSVMYQRDQSFYDRMQTLEFVLQILTLMWASEDVTNNALYEELQKQDREYLQKIIEQNNEILKYLSDMKRG